MFYSLSSDVYLVKGVSRGCLYDFNHCKLYNLNHNLMDFIDLIDKGNCESTAPFQAEQQVMLDKMIALGLITVRENPEHHDIQELRRDDFRCRFAWIEITNKCNLRCVHCYNESSIQAAKVMSYEDYRLVLDSLLKLGVQKVQIIGGEPFFHRNLLKEMLDYTIGKVPFIEIFTNGTLIPDDWFAFLAQNHIHIALSVYSYESDMHDKVTQCKGSWKRTNKTIRKLKEYHIPYRVCNVLMKGVSLGKKDTDLYTLRKDKDVARMSGRANFNLLSDDLIRKRLITKNSFRYPIRKAFCRGEVSGHNCFADKVYISADLTVYPCVMERRLNHGLVSKDQGIVLKRRILELNKDAIQGCSECEYRYCCFDCRPNSLSGNIYEKPWYCTYNPHTGEWIPEDVFVLQLREKWGGPDD